METGASCGKRPGGEVTMTRVFSVQETLDGGVVVAGWTSSFGAVNGDLLLLKFDSKGAIPDCQHLGTSSATVRGQTTVSGVGSSGSVKDTNPLSIVSPGTGSVFMTERRSEQSLHG